MSLADLSLFITNRFTMFWNSHKIDKEMIPKISFSSKATLKKEALLMANGDIKRATEIYDFLCKDMDDIPISDPIQPTMLNQVKDTASNVFGWVKDNKDDILSTIDYLRSLKKGVPQVPPTQEPIPKL